MVGFGTCCVPHVDSSDDDEESADHNAYFPEQAVASVRIGRASHERWDDNRRGDDSKCA